MSRIPATNYNQTQVQPNQPLPSGVVSLGNGVYAPAPQQPKSGLFGLGLGGILGGKRHNKTKKSRKGGLNPFLPNSMRAMARPNMAAGIEACKLQYPDKGYAFERCLDTDPRTKTRGTFLTALSGEPVMGGRRTKKNKKTRKGKGKSGKSRK